jgi:hypothetical protein
MRPLPAAGSLRTRRFGRLMPYVVKVETEYGPRYYGPYSSREYAGNASHGANGVEIHDLLPPKGLEDS